ncbi:MAG: maleylacetoacetate isomerase [Alphaproteobacteria bacterium]|nr:maleylacetoacetate isomerase [Alphaproteobacteria bacterium]
MRLTLYGYWRSSASWRVRIGLHLKGLDFAYAPVHLVADGGQHRGEAHRARNPMAQVPVLAVEEGGHVRYLSQSLAILGWLDDQLPSPRLWPVDPWQRATVTQLAEVVNAGIQPLQNLGVLRRVQELGGDRAGWARDVIGDGLDALEAMAAATAGRFVVGDQVTAADLCLVPQLYNARRFGLDLAGFPTLTRVEAACAELPAFQAAHPDRQPDAVPPESP